MMNLTNIVLNTTDKRKLSNYISEIFDKPIVILNNQYSINMEGIKFIFKQVEGEIDQSDFEHTQLEFSVDSLEALEDLLKKVQFYHYRLNAGEKTARDFDIPDIHGDCDIHYFEVADTDNRKWKFSTQIQIN